jgi:hypothetical protein
VLLGPGKSSRLHGCCVGVVLLRRWWTGRRGQLAAYLRTCVLAQEVHQQPALRALVYTQGRGWLVDEQRRPERTILAAGCAHTAAAAGCRCCSQSAAAVSQQLLLLATRFCNSGDHRQLSSLPAGDKARSSLRIHLWGLYSCTRTAVQPCSCMAIRP